MSSEQPLPIIGGTGDLGFGLAVRFARAGVHVVIGSRDQARAEEAAARARELVPEGRIDGQVNAEAATRGELVVLSVPFAAQAGTLKGLAEALQPGQVLVDATVPLATAVGGKPTRLLGVPQGSAAAQAQELVPEGVTVVSAFHTLAADKLKDLGGELDEDVLIAGDSREAKRKLAELVRRVPGLRPINAGTLEAARLVEGLTPLLISVNVRNKVHAGIKLTGIAEPKW